MPKSREDKFEWKSKYFMKLLTALDEYDKFFIVGVDNVGWVGNVFDCDWFSFALKSDIW